MLTRAAIFQCNEFTRLKARALSTTVLVTLLATPLAAQSTLDWDGGAGAPGSPLGGDGIWIEGGETDLWQNGATDDQAFTAGDDAVFGPSATEEPYTVTIDTDVSANGVTFNTDGVTLDGAGTLSITGVAGVTTAGDTASISTAILGDTAFGGAGDLALSGGVDGAVAMGGTGTLILNDGSVGDVTTNSGTVEITGGTVASVNNTSGSTLRITDGAVSGDVSNAGNLEMNGGTLGNVTNDGISTIEDTQAVSGDFINNGLFGAAGAGAEVLTVDGTVSLNEGSNLTTDAAGDTVNTLTITAESGITINSDSAFNGGDDLDGSIVLQGDIINNADIDFTGDLTLTGSLTTTNAIEQSGDLDLTGNDLIITGSDAEYSVASSAEITNGGRLALDDGGSFTLDPGGVANFDTVALLSGDITLDIEDGTFNVANGLSNEGDAVLFLDTGVAVEGAVTNSAQVTFNGGSVDRLINTADGAVDVLGGGAVSTSVTNAGDFDVTGGTFTVGSFTNEAGGSLSIGETVEFAATGSAEDTPGVLNAQGASMTISGTVSSFVQNLVDGTMAVESTASVDRIANTGQLTLNGGTIGRLANLSNEADVNNPVRGEVTVNGDTTVGQAVSNFGSFDIASGGNLTTTSNDVEFGLGNFINRDGAALDIESGGTLNSRLTNVSGADIDLAGTIAGRVDNQEGAEIRVSGADAQISASGISLVNAGEVTIAPDGVLTLGGVFDNSAGTLNLRGAGRVSGDVTGGTIAVRGAQSTIDGNLVLSDGTIDLADGDDDLSDTRLTITGDAELNGTLDYDLTFDPDVSAGSATSDRIIVGGTVSGAPTFNFDFVGTPQRLTGVEVLQYEINDGLALDDLVGFEGVNEFDYFLADNGAGSIGLQSRVNTGIASLAATVGLTENVVGTIINRPSSPYVADLAIDPGDDNCGAGGWARATAGRADADGAFTDNVSGLSSEAPVELTYSGFQFGGDLACFGGAFNGWDLAFGGIAGFNVGESTNEVFAIDAVGNATDTLNSVTETDINQRYAGAYLTAARGRLFGDIQLRFEVTDFESNNKEIVAGRGIDLNDEEYQNRSQTLSGSVGYSWPLNEVGDLSFVSLAGFQVSRSETDSIDLGEDGTLELDDKTSKLGFVSGTLAKTTIRPDNMGLLSYFGTATYYEDFSDSQEATLTNGTSRNPFELSNLGSYGEVSAGINYVRILNPGQVGSARQFNAAVRLDARTGDSVESWGITAQMRLQF